LKEKDYIAGSLHQFFQRLLKKFIVITDFGEGEHARAALSNKVYLKQNLSKSKNTLIFIGPFISCLVCNFVVKGLQSFQNGFILSYKQSL